MKWNQILKHSLTAFLLLSLTVGLIQLFSLDVTSENLGNRILSGSFFISAFVLTATYRIDWIGRQKFNWFTFGLFLLCLVGLLIMLSTPKNVMALWKPTLAIFILLTAITLFWKLKRQNWSGTIAKVCLLITTILFMIPLMFHTSSRDYFTFSFGFLIVTCLFSIIQLWLPEKKTSSTQ